MYGTIKCKAVVVEATLLSMIDNFNVISAVSLSEEGKMYALISAIIIMA